MDDVIDGTPSVEEEIQNHQNPASDTPIVKSITTKTTVSSTPTANTIEASVNEQKQAALPQTGNQKQSTLSIIGLSMLSLLSFGLLKNKKRA